MRVRVLGRRSWFAAAILVVAVAGLGAAPNKKTVRLPEPYDLFYGVYLNGAKVGWMRSTMTRDDRITFSMQVEATVVGMGRRSRLVLRETRAYDATEGRLVALSFEQTAATGGVSVVGRREGRMMHLDIRAGGKNSTQQVAINEDLDDALAPWRLATRAVVGETASTTHFDPSLLRPVNVVHAVASVSSRNLGGVAARTIQLKSDYPELELSETSWLDAAGKVLESRIGGFFVARLEPRDVAKQITYQQDILVSAVVTAPAPLDNQAQIRGLKLTFRGFGDRLPPSTLRQKVSRQGDDVTVALSRRPLPAGVPWSRLPKDSALHRYGSPTPFIQSDAPEIVAAARRVAGSATDLATVSERLVHFVFHHVRDEYVPAYSNALDALHSRRGDCTEHSVLYVAMARALGIPARVAVGIAYWEPGGGFGWHAWAEVYLQGAWYSVDPTWDQPTADATHVKLADGSPAEQARIVMLLGRLRLRDMQVL